MRIGVPGDKSLTQRSLIFAALGDGESRISGLLFGGDAASTAGALRMLGAPLGPLPRQGEELRVEGVGLRGLSAPTAPLDLGNSGTGSRLLIGVLAGCALEAVLTGDESLRSRPMARVTEPLGRMGATFRYLAEPGRLPMALQGRHPLLPLRWDSPVSSAQVKSALLLAGITGQTAVSVREPRRSRDHTERLLEIAGVPLTAAPDGDGWRVDLPHPPARLDPLDFRVPGDFSSAAFFLAFAALGGAGGALEIEGVGLNPTRTAFLDVLRRMGARVDVSELTGTDRGEPVGVLCGYAGDLVATDVGADEVPSLIDEIPLIAVLAARAQGITRVTGARELRHKESDRIAALVENLRTLGVEVEELEDGLEVRGSDRPLTGRIRTRGDHRIAMAFGVLGGLPGNRIAIDDPDAADVSFPGFWTLLQQVRGAV